mmetsp:Transcript_11158/g.26811  ORF Transcript_11158/g.26811 Transcript_11158/m.26811 type:complete len:851 (-) Transcript_11158:60-2612(-)
MSDAMKLYSTKIGEVPCIEILHRILDEVAIFAIGNFPLLKQVTLETLETIFATKTLGRQLALAIALETGVVTVSQFLKIANSLLSNFSSRSRLIRSLQKQQDEASSQDDWMDLAERIDSIQGNDVWRSDNNSRLYEGHRISARIDEFVHLMRRRDIFELMFVLRGGIGRNKFGLLHEGLFSKAMAGTKVLVETYHNVVCASLDFVCDAPVADVESPIPTDARLAFFNETRHSYGRSALLLSGGAALGFYHVGVVKTLMENRLMPRVLGGSSAGSIVCAMIGTRTDEECANDLFNVRGTTAPGHSGTLMLNFFRPLHIPKMSDDEQRMKLPVKMPVENVFQNTAGFFHDAKRTLQVCVPISLRYFTSILYDILTLKTRPQEILMNDTEHFRECLRINVGDFTFQEAFDRTGRILNITVTPNNASDPPRLLNYLTAPHVLVWSAAVASSSLPGVFESNRLLVKDADGTIRFECSEGARFRDGSMEQDLPMQQLSEMFNVNHFIISQANPHAVMFASYSHLKSIWSTPLTGLLNSIRIFLKDQCRSWLSHFVEMVGARRYAPQHATSRRLGVQIFVQEYEGRDCDVSLIPWLGHRGLFSALLHALYNPSKREFEEWIEAAQRQTWKHIPAIKSHVAEEITLDQCVQRLRKRIIAEKWDKHRQIDSLSAKMDAKVPSFFTSPSLVNFGGLGIADQTIVQDLELFRNKDSTSEPQTALPLPLDIKPGWSGLGLKGNRSAASLESSASYASGLFIEGDDHAKEQVAGEQTNPMPPFSGIKSSLIPTSHDDSKKYLKTTNMASFYYRKFPLGHSNLNEMQRSLSHGQQLEHGERENLGSRFQRQKSKSHTNFGSAHS